MTDAIAQLDDSVDSAEKAEKLQEQIAAERTKALENLEAIAKNAAKAGDQLLLFQVIPPQDTRKRI